MYLGMHSLGDVLAGLILSAVLLPPVLAFVHVSDQFLVSSPWSPLVVMAVTLTAIMIFPCPGVWSPSAVTAIDVMSCYQGAHLGQWSLHQLGYLTTEYQTTLSLSIPSTTWSGLLVMLLRVVLGGLVAGIIRSVVKDSSFSSVSTLFQEPIVDHKQKANKYSTARIISKVQYEPSLYRERSVY